MGHRLSKIYTRTGDQGTTGLGDGSRVNKNNLRIEAIGAVDELNSHIGMLATYDLPGTIAGELVEIQHDLFDIGGELSVPGSTALPGTHVERLERILDELNADLKPLKDFILPGGTPAAAACHVARTVCRRAERRIVGLADVEPVNQSSVCYLNRLSDLLFVMARILNRAAGVNDVLWDRSRNT